MIKAIPLLLTFFLPAVARAEDCAAIDRRGDLSMPLLDYVPDPLGEVDMAGHRAFDSLKQCPNSPVLWYLAARSAELLDGPSGGKAFADHGGLRKIIADASQHAPKSAPVATVAARVDGGSAAARKAVALDPRYRPAQRALALALAREGAIPEALQIAAAPHPTKQDAITQADVLLAAGRPAEAVVAARKSLKTLANETTEPTLNRDNDRDANEVLGLALLKLGRKAEAAKALKTAAAEGSSLAQQQLPH